MIMTHSKQSLLIQFSIDRPYIHLEKHSMEFIGDKHKKEVNNILVRDSHKKRNLQVRIKC